MGDGARGAGSGSAAGSERAVDGARVADGEQAVDGTRAVDDARTVSGARAVTDGRAVADGRAAGGKREADGARAVDGARTDDAEQPAQAKQTAGAQQTAGGKPPAGAQQAADAEQPAQAKQTAGAQQTTGAKPPAGTERTGPQRRASRAGMKLVVSRRGRADVALVAGLRLASAALTGVALVATARLLADLADPAKGIEQAQNIASWAPAGLAALLAGLAAAAEVIYGGAAARREERSIRRRLLRAAYSTQTLAESQSTDPAKLVALHTDNSERVTEYRQVYFGSAVAAIAIPFLTLAYVAIAIDAVLGLTIVALCPLIPVLLGLFGKFFRKASAHSRRQRMALSGKYLDAIRNLVVIRLFGAGPRIEKHLRETGERNRGALMRLLAGNQVVIIIMDGLFSLVLVCCSAAMAIARFQAGAIDLGQVLSVVLLTVLLLEPLGQVAGFFYIGMAGRASEKAIGAYLSRHSGGARAGAAGAASRGGLSGDDGGARAAVSGRSGDDGGARAAASGRSGDDGEAGVALDGRAGVADGAGANSNGRASAGPAAASTGTAPDIFSTGTAPEAAGISSDSVGGVGLAAGSAGINSDTASGISSAVVSADSTPGAGGITARGLRFDYGRGPVLRGVDLNVPEGAKVAIVGDSGEGKSTLLGLLRGSLRLQEGEITIAGQSLGAMSPAQISRLSAPVSQRTWLFTGSIADNLRLAKADATDEEMWRALRLAQVADEVEGIGLHRDIGEGGARISGGQAQRISLARALLSGRKVLLLDEPTSHVDIESEARITRAIADLGRQWTLLIVTHRRAIAQSADAVLRMRQGVLVPVDAADLGGSRWSEGQPGEGREPQSEEARAVCSEEVRELQSKAGRDEAEGAGQALAEAAPGGAGPAVASAKAGEHGAEASEAGAKLGEAGAATGQADVVTGEAGAGPGVAGSAGRQPEAAFGMPETRKKDAEGASND